jgi:hypothetical protein
VEHRTRGLLRQRKKANQRRALTNCRGQSEEQVRTAKGSQPARGTYLLSRAERGTDQDSKRKSTSEGYSPTAERRARDWSGQRKKASQRETLTSCRAQNEELVKDSEGKPASERHSPPVEHRARDWSGQRNKANQRGALTYCRAQVRDGSGLRKKAGQQGALTVCQAQSEGLIRAAKESQPKRGTHLLSGAGRGIGQGSERAAASEGHSHTVEGRARDLSGK